MTLAPNLSVAWANAVVEELALAGVRHAVVSPGSRSAPLALAFAAHRQIRDRSVLDERSASYFGLGLARCSRGPVALLCTSGTAAANYLPAAAEAHHAGVPLILLTADRPPELRDCGSAQTIDQVGLFGGRVGLAVDLQAPIASDAAFRQLRATVARAVAEAKGVRPGPVHLNLPFREPLDPTEVGDEREALARLGRLAATGRGPGPLIRVGRPAGVAAAAPDLDRLAALLRAESRGWIAVGPLDAGPDLAAEICGLAQATGWAVLADPLSGLRAGPHDRSAIVDAHDAVLRATGFVERALPRVVLRLGAMPTSKRYREILEAHPEIRQIVVDATGWSEPTAAADEIVRASPGLLVPALLERMPQDGASSPFAQRWVGAGRTARGLLDRGLSQHAGLSEPCVARIVGDGLADGTMLFCANSMPIRDLDAFWRGSERRVRVLANRGANGIDGTLSSALGVAAASDAPCVALIGDLALLHDASGLLTARGEDVDLHVVVVDNSGGGIFEFLPIATAIDRDVFERHLATPPDVDLAAVIRGFGLPCTEAQTRDELEQAVACGGRGVRFTRVQTRRRENAELHHKLFSSVASALDSIGGEHG